MRGGFGEGPGCCGGPARCRRVTLPAALCAAVVGLAVSGSEALYGPSKRVAVEAGAMAALTGNVGGPSVRVRGTMFGNWARQPALATKVRRGAAGRRGATLPFTASCVLLLLLLPLHALLSPHPSLSASTRQAEFYCRGADCGTLCTQLRHHCLKKPDLDLCPKCFKGGRRRPLPLPAAPFSRLSPLPRCPTVSSAHPAPYIAPPPSTAPPAEGKFPAGMSVKDFIRLAAADAVPDDSGWTDQETLLLLEGGGLWRGAAAGRTNMWAQGQGHVWLPRIRIATDPPPAASPGARFCGRAGPACPRR